jgi:hypothetical protein
VNHKEKSLACISHQVATATAPGQKRKLARTVRDPGRVATIRKKAVRSGTPRVCTHGNPAEQGRRPPIPWEATPGHGWAGAEPWLPWPPDAAARDVPLEGDWQVEVASDGGREDAVYPGRVAADQALLLR